MYIYIYVYIGIYILRILILGPHEVAPVVVAPIPGSLLCTQTVCQRRAQSFLHENKGDFSRVKLRSEIFETALANLNIFQELLSELLE